MVLQVAVRMFGNLRKMFIGDLKASGLATSATQVTGNSRTHSLLYRWV